MISIVVPVYNESENLDELNKRLNNIMKSNSFSYEIIYVNDGSTDNSKNILSEFSSKNKNIKTINFFRNFGQHAAVIAGFKKATGDYVVTLDADLQNPPEEIPKLILEIEKGYDMVCGVRKNRKDSFLRKFLSKIMNRIISRLVKNNLSDFGCMLRVYKISLVRIIAKYGEKSVYVPSFAAWLTNNIKEVDVDHHHRLRGKSKYNLLILFNQAFDLITSYTILPLQIIFITGFFVFFSGLFLFTYLMFYRFVIGSPSSLTSFVAILILVSGIIMLSIGVLSEYLIRIHRESKKFPLYLSNDDD